MDLTAVARRQYGIVSRSQALASGMSASAVTHRVDGGRWRRVHRGVYAMHTGPLDWWARASAAVLYAGSGAALSLTAAAYAWGLEDREPPVIKLVVPADRSVRRPAGVRVRRRRRVVVATRRRLPVTSVVQTILDIAAEPACTPDDMATLVGRAVQRGVVTLEELRLGLRAARAHPQRRLLSLVLGDLHAGAGNALERRALRDVLLAHGLTGFTCQVPDACTEDGQSGWRRDFENEEFGVVFEVDGQHWHDGDRFQQDRRRDRSTAGDGKVTLRATWLDHEVRRCELALDLARTLRRRGWTGDPTLCGPHCVMTQWAREVG